MSPRISGILLHPTSLPGPHGSGDLGPAAFHFIDWLATAAQTTWQVLPLTPVGPGNSPYASVSAFAGSPSLVALEPLVERGWLPPIAPADLTAFDATRVDFDRVLPWRMARLAAASDGFFARASAADRRAFEAFYREEAYWLDDYALFMALDAEARVRGVYQWSQWEPKLARRDAAALAAARNAYAGEICFWQFVQWRFFSQWRALMRYAQDRGVAIVGDLPIFVAFHSADCWARPDLFQLDAQLEPRVVAGVPPDYFSPTGQRWGNPLYDWPAMQREGFAWWIARLKHELQRADLVRIDHFRGFAGYWEISADKPTAVEGRWVDAPGTALFAALKSALGTLPVIAEDLGLITPDVEKLRDDFSLPGMRILQFGFGGDATHAFLPHNYVPNCAVYTGTHDNDTARGWFDTAPARERAYALAYLNTDATNVHWAMIRAASASVARIAIFPMQDVMGLGAEARMNTPGSLGHWTWRFDWTQVSADTATRLAHIAAAFGRAPIDRLTLP